MSNSFKNFFKNLKIVVHNWIESNNNRNKENVETYAQGTYKDINESFKPTPKY